MLLEDLKLNLHTARINRQLKAKTASSADSARSTSTGTVTSASTSTSTATATGISTGAQKPKAIKKASTKPVPNSGFGAWRRSRPFVGSVLTILAGIEMFFSSQLDLGNIKVQVGVEGLQSTIIPIVLVTLGILTMFNPVHRIFYGIISLVVAVYALVGLNLGGFFVGMLLGAIGGILIVSWMPKRADASETTASDSGASKSNTVEADEFDKASVERRSTAAEPRPLVHSR